MVQRPTGKHGGIAAGRQVPRGARRAARAAAGTVARGNPGGAGQVVGDSVRLLAIALSRSIGSGKTIVELLSPAILASVCK